MSVFQTSYSQRPSEAIIGQFAEAYSPRTVTGKAARGLIKAGYGVFRAPSVGTSGSEMLDPGEVFQIPNPGVAVDVDAILASGGASSTSIQVISGAALNGVVGGAEMQPARIITFAFSASTDWDPTNGTLVGIDHNGRVVTETIAISTSGSPSSTARFRSVTSFTIPVQTGAGGTFTMGIAAMAALTIDDFVGVAVRKPIKTTIATAGLYGYPGITSTLVTADYVDSEMVSVLDGGAIWGYVEEAVVEGDPVYVRIASGSGGSQLGAFRNDADTATAVLVVGARFKRNAAALGPAKIRFPIDG